MRRRILSTVVAVTAIALATLFVPAALAVRARDAEGQNVELQRDAAVAAASLPVEHPEEMDLAADGEHRYGLYLPDGARVAGEGPRRAEPAVLQVVDGRPPTVITSGDEAVTALLVRSNDPDRSYVLRAAESRQEARQATAHSIAGLSVAAIAILAGAGAVAWVLAARLARPVEALADAAARLDDGDFTATAGPGAASTGITEIDEVAAALTHTGERVRRTLERERAFSADVSHQLRTPLSAMRAAVEAEQVDPRPDRNEVLDDVVDQIDRLDNTLTGLLALARDTHVDRRPIDLGQLVRRTASRWAASLADAGRTLELDIPDTPPQPALSATAIEHVLDVLLDNALTHGRGTITARVDTVDGAARLAVGDQGRIDGDRSQLFARRPPDAGGSGIGLHLARTLVEAEGGRFRLVATDPTTFEITMPLTLRQRS